MPAEYGRACVGLTAETLTRAGMLMLAVLGDTEETPRGKADSRPTGRGWDHLLSRQFGYGVRVVNKGLLPCLT